jgi:hypothetical protein
MWPEQVPALLAAVDTAAERSATTVGASWSERT